MGFSQQLRVQMVSLLLFILLQQSLYFLWILPFLFLHRSIYSKKRKCKRSHPSPYILHLKNKEFSDYTLNTIRSRQLVVMSCWFQVFCLKLRKHLKKRTWHSGFILLLWSWPLTITPFVLWACKQAWNSCWHKTCCKDVKTTRKKVEKHT